MFHGAATVLSNRQLAIKTFLIRLETPDLASAIRPGQFFDAAAARQHRYPAHWKTIRTL